MGLLDHPSYQILSDTPRKEDILPAGRDFKERDYHRDILSQLQPHPSQWRVLDKHDYAELTTVNHGGRLIIFTRKKGKWVEVHSIQQAKAGDGMAVFVRRPTAQGNGGGGVRTAIIAAAAPLAYENLDPTVLIASPDNGAQLSLDNKKQLTTSFKEHTFQPGDTVNSVVRQLTGENKPGAILNYNSAYNNRKLPQSGDTVRVAVGQALKVDGTVSNHGSVVLNWIGPSYGSKRIDVASGGPNQVMGWDTTLDNVKPGTYSLTAIAGSAIHRAEFTLINDKPWIGVEYRDLYGELVKNAPFKLTFADKSTLRGDTGEDGQFYKTPVPPGPVGIEFYPDKTAAELDEDVAQKRAALKQALDAMYQNARQEADIRRRTLDEQNIVMQGFIYLGAFLVGTYDGFVPEMPEIPEEIVQALGQVWDAVMEADLSKFDEAIARLKQAGQEVVAAVAEALKMLMYDRESRQVLVDFAVAYASDCITGVDSTYYAGYAIGAVAMTIILTIGGALLMGYGALIGVAFGATKIASWLSQFIDLLKQLGQAIHSKVKKLSKNGKTDNTNKLEQPKPSEQVQKPKSVEGKKAKSAPVVLAKHNVPCFHPYDKKNYNAMSEAERRKYLENYNKQLQRQQDAINEMSVADYKAAREAFNKYGRNPAAEAAQESVRKNFEKDLKNSIARSLRSNGLSPEQADVESITRSKQLMEKLAALHEPDMVAGGWTQPDPKAMGRSDVNSSIGGSWGTSDNSSSRVAGMDRSADKAIAGGKADAKMNVKLETCRGKGLK